MQSASFGVLERGYTIEVNHFYFFSDTLASCRILTRFLLVQLSASFDIWSMGRLIAFFLLGHLGVGYCLFVASALPQ